MSLLTLLTVSSARADQLICSGTHADVTAAHTAILKGETGHWLPSSMLNELLRDSEVKTFLGQQVEALKFEVQELETAVGFHEQRVATLESERDRLRVSLTTSMETWKEERRQRMVAEDRMDNLFSGQPLVWVGVGAGVATVVVLLIAN